MEISEEKDPVQDLFAAVSVGVFIAASIPIGLRMLLLHRRTGDAPELLLGSMLLLVAGLGYPCAIAAQVVGPAAARPFVVASSVLMNSGSALLFLFTWRVFRPEEAWARYLAFAGVVALGFQAGLRSFDALSQAEVRVEDRALGAVLLMLVVYVWAAVESLRNYRMMRRRMRFGLGDAIVCDRFMLFGAMALCSTAGLVLNGAALWMHIEILESPGIQFGSSVFGLVQAGVMVLAFAPPRAYLEWVRERPRAWAS
jgi:hypothetical protein